jgi:outer membrane receptor protein involved in Fe transport
VTNYKTSRRLSISAILVYSTGRPITYPASIYYSGGSEVLHYSKRNEYRIPDYFRIDFSINYEGNLLARKWLHSSWMLNIYNITGRKNAYSVYFEANEGLIQGYKLSIFGQPIVTLTWNFKFGNYASE